MRTAPSLPSHQRGALLILLVIALGVLAVTLFVGMLSSSEIQMERDKKTAAALAEAKAALIGRAVRDDNRPGSLPCPDTNNDGSADLLSGPQCPSYIGRLPWRTLGLPDLRDGYGERLWYALSNNLRDDASAQPINSNTSLTMQVYASDKVTLLTSAGNQAAAVIFSVGPVLNGQTRDTANENLATNYLDKTGTSPSDFNNAIAAGPFIQGPVKDSAENIVVNDKLLIITRRDLFSVVEKRIAGEIIGVNTPPTSGLRLYYANSSPPATAHVYPYAGDSSGNEITNSISGNVPYTVLSFTSSIRSMLINNKWFDITTYQVNLARNSAQLGLNYCTEKTTLGQQGTPVCY